MPSVRNCNVNSHEDERKYIQVKVRVQTVDWLCKYCSIILANPESVPLPPY